LFASMIRKKPAAIEVHKQEPILLD
jgi:hypothetical protein